MKCLLIFICLFSTVRHGFSQTYLPTQSSSVKRIEIYDINGAPFKNKYSDVEGSPFFSDQWMYSSLQTKDGRVIEAVKIRLDIVSQELHLLSNNIEMIALGEFSQIVMKDSATRNIFKFRMGYPAIDNQISKNYYLILSEGPLTLLKSLSKVIVERKNDVSGEIKKEFVLYKDYYIFNNNQMNRLKKDKTFILKALNDKKEKIEEFTKDHSTNFKNIDDIVILFNFYNSLFTL